jgi:hypothetical protein
MWRKGKDQYYLISGEFTICKVYLAGVCKYELWNKTERLGIFASVEEAKKRQLTTLNADNVIDD